MSRPFAARVLPRPGVVAALARWEAERWVRAGRTTLAASVLVLWLLVVLVGDLLGLLVSGHDRGFGVGYVLALSLAAGLGLSEDRELGFHRLLVVNFVRPSEYLVGKVAALAGVFTAAGAVSFLVLAGLTGGAWSFAGWEAVALTLFALGLLPVLALAETLVETRLPAVVVLLALLLALLVLLMSGGPVRAVIGALGLDVQAGEWDSLSPLAVRAAGLLVGGTFLALPIVRLRLPHDRAVYEGVLRNIAPPSASHRTSDSRGGGRRGRTQQVGEHQAEEGARGPAPRPDLQQADPRDHGRGPRGRG